MWVINNSIAYMNKLVTALVHTSQSDLMAMYLTIINGPSFTAVSLTC